MNDGRILEGMRVVEAAAFVAAPLGGMTLGQLGADVIRIDPIRGGLDQRRWPVTVDDVSLFWCGLNKGKRSVALDVTTPEGRELAMALICAPGEDAGMMITNFPPRGWLDYETLRARRADLIQLTVQGDRHGGSAVDYTVNSRVGLPYVTGPRLRGTQVGGQGGDQGGDQSGERAGGARPDGGAPRDGDAERGEVVNHVLPAWDLVTGQMVATGLLAAERHRQRKGQGQHIRLALEDMALAVMGHLGFIAEAQLGQTRERHGNYLFGAFGRDFVCKDGERVMVVGLTGKQWRGLCDAMEMGDAMAQLGHRLGLDLAAEGNRFLARMEIAAAVERWMAHRSFAQVAAALDKHGVCWGRYQSIMQLVTHDPACSEDNPMFKVVDQPGVGLYLAPGTPLDFSATGRMHPQPAPRLGQHTEQVLAELLGLGAAEFGRLHDRGIVAGPDCE